ncbi:hypothetical protein LCGC14_0822370 [marine sediment metagenome]|uniref:Uncharacterized protein n=1 Tax=marine sediment metagenome TaxID=412755 RepID=A0A0F9Q3P9_9ZZZZ
MSEEKEALRKLIMLISDLRAKDEERISSHVNFMTSSDNLSKKESMTSFIDNNKYININY